MSKISVTHWSQSILTISDLRNCSRTSHSGWKARNGDCQRKTKSTWSTIRSDGFKRADVKARRTAEEQDQIVDGGQRITKSRECCFTRFLFTGRGELQAISPRTTRSSRLSGPYPPLGRSLARSFSNAAAKTSEPISQPVPATNPYTTRIADLYTDDGTYPVTTDASYPVTAHATSPAATSNEQAENSSRTTPVIHHASRA